VARHSWTASHLFNKWFDLYNCRTSIYNAAGWVQVRNGSISDSYLGQQHRVQHRLRMRFLLKKTFKQQKWRYICSLPPTGFMPMELSPVKALKASTYFTITGSSSIEWIHGVATNLQDFLRKEGMECPCWMQKPQLTVFWLTVMAAWATWRQVPAPLSRLNQNTISQSTQR